MLGEPEMKNGDAWRCVEVTGGAKRCWSGLEVMEVREERQQWRARVTQERDGGEMLRLTGDEEWW